MVFLDDKQDEDILRRKKRPKLIKTVVGHKLLNSVDFLEGEDRFYELDACKMSTH